MCGIAGFCGRRDEKAKIIRSMTDVMRHRGPDSEGQYTDDLAALGHRRLSIIDITSSGDQPIFNEDSSKVLIFNGEIYNYQDLREELVQKGHVFRTNTDSETILHGYEEWGTDVLSRFRGMFAFAIWDKEEKIMFLARDFFGIKPLYYAVMNGTFMFASEIKALLAHPDFVKEFNEDVLGNYLSFQFVPSDETFFKGVFCLPPGHYLKYAADKDDTVPEVVRYFEPAFSGDAEGTLEELTDQVQAVMEDSVRMHKVSDVEVASYLSSGVDSSYLTYLSEVDRTFTVGFDEGAYSEIADAKAFAGSIHMENDAKVITPDEYWNSLSDVMYYMDEPVADPSAVALYFLSGEAAKKVKVVLSGEGSDEFFGGYNIYCEPLGNTWYDRVPLGIRKGLGSFARKHMPQGMKGRGFLMRRSMPLEERYYTNATTVFSPEQADRVLKKGCTPKITEITGPLYAKTKGEDPVTRMQYVDLHVWLVHDILMKGDKMGMANSIEVRVPFLDKEVFEFARHLPLDKKVRAPRTKVTLREAADRVIRKETAEKKKLGFPIPIRVWLKEDRYYQRVRDMFMSESAEKFFDTSYLLEMLDGHRAGTQKNIRTDDSRRIWTVYIFLIWYERFFAA